MELALGCAVMHQLASRQPPVSDSYRTDKLQTWARIAHLVLVFFRLPWGSPTDPNGHATRLPARGSAASMDLSKHLRHQLLGFPSPGKNHKNAGTLSLQPLLPLFAFCERTASIPFITSFISSKQVRKCLSLAALTMLLWGNSSFCFSIWPQTAASNAFCSQRGKEENVHRRTSQQSPGFEWYKYSTPSDTSWWRLSGLRKSSCVSMAFARWWCDMCPILGAALEKSTSISARRSPSCAWMLEIFSFVSFSISFVCPNPNRKRLDPKTQAAPMFGWKTFGAVRRLPTAHRRRAGRRVIMVWLLQVSGLDSIDV